MREVDSAGVGATETNCEGVDRTGADNGSADKGEFVCIGFNAREVDCIRA